MSREQHLRTEAPIASADPAAVAALMEYLRAAFEQYVAEHDVAYLDGFMAAHNFHKLVIFDLADRQGLTGDARKFLLKAAADTFARTMERGR